MTVQALVEVLTSELRALTIRGPNNSIYRNHCRWCLTEVQTSSIGGEVFECALIHKKNCFATRYLGAKGDEL